jgi:hypothetical protein
MSNLQNIVELLRSKTVTDPETGCWIWTGPVAGGHEGAQYPQMRGGEWRHQYAHRVMWELHHGLLPKGAQVCHSCDESLCINPDHLFVGTNAINRADSVAKLRHAKGESHGLHRWPAETVLAIRADRATGMKLKDIVVKHGVPFKTVEKICTGKTWRHLR